MLRYENAPESLSRVTMNHVHSQEQKEQKNTSKQR